MNFGAGRATGRGTLRKVALLAAVYMALALVLLRIVRRS
jgi:hypothetical protein